MQNFSKKSAEQNWLESCYVTTINRTNMLLTSTTTSKLYQNNWQNVQLMTDMKLLLQLMQKQEKIFYLRREIEKELSLKFLI